MDESLEKATHAVVARGGAETGATVGYRIRRDRPARINFLSAPTAIPTLISAMMKAMLEVVTLDACFSMCSMN